MYESPTAIIVRTMRDSFGNLFFGASDEDSCPFFGGIFEEGCFINIMSAGAAGAAARLRTLACSILIIICNNLGYRNTGDSKVSGLLTESGYTRHWGEARGKAAIIGGAQRSCSTCAVICICKACTVDQTLP